MATDPHHNTLIDVLGVLIFVVFAVILSAELIALNLPAYLIALTAFGGYLLADLVSGLVHFAGDTFGSVHTPLIGKTFIFPFREHHIDQLAITRHNFFVTNGHNCLVSLPVMIAMHVVLFPVAQGNIVQSTLFALGFFLVISVFATNQIHKWAHIKHPPKIVRLLQNLHLILNPKHHDLHHTAPHTSYFCITTGWLNPILEKLHFFKGIKAMCGYKK